MENDEKNDLQHLNALLKGELTAVDSYLKAVRNVKDKRIADMLETNFASHRVRVYKLSTAISDSGHKPETEPGSWQSLAKMMMKGAAGLGDASILTALEEGEDALLSEYEWRLLSMKGDSRLLVKQDLMPEHQSTHQRVSSLASGSFGGFWPPVPETIREI